MKIELDQKEIGDTMEMLLKHLIATNKTPEEGICLTSIILGKMLSVYYGKNVESIALSMNSVLPIILKEIHKGSEYSVLVKEINVSAPQKDHKAYVTTPSSLH